MQDSWIDKEEFAALVGKFSRKRRRSSRPSSQKPPSVGPEPDGEEPDASSEPEVESREVSGPTPDALADTPPLPAFPAPEEGTEEESGEPGVGDVGAEQDFREEIAAEEQEAYEPVAEDGAGGEPDAEEAEAEEPDAAEAVRAHGGAAEEPSSLFREGEELPAFPDFSDFELGPAFPEKGEATRLDDLETEVPDLLPSELPEGGQTDSPSPDRLDEEDAGTAAQSQAGATASEPEDEPPLPAGSMETVTGLVIEDAPVGGGARDRAPQFLLEAERLIEGAGGSDSNPDVIRAVRALASARERADCGQLLKPSGARSGSAFSPQPVQKDVPQATENSRQEREVAGEETGAGPTDSAVPVEISSLEKWGEADAPAAPESIPSAESPPELAALPQAAEVPMEVEKLPDTLAARLANLAELISATTGTTSITITDGDGYLLYGHSSGEESDDSLLSPNRPDGIPIPDSRLIGEAVIAASQTTTPSGDWLCAVRGASPCEHLFVTFLGRRPLAREEIEQWSYGLAEAVFQENGSFSTASQAPSK